MNMYELKESRQMKPKTFANMVGLSSYRHTECPVFVFANMVGSIFSFELLCLQVSNMLYERRFGPFFVEPIVAGLDPVTFQPYICNMVSLFDVLHAT